VAKAEQYIRSHPDHTSYLLLDEFREYFPEAYSRLSDDTKAAILCRCLAFVHTCNDWGTLEHDNEAGRALLETGRAALPYLRPLLDDRSRIHYEIFKAYTPSEKEQYRRCDFAYRYACLILGQQPIHDAKPQERDKAIERLRSSLKAAAAAK
jgi:hypothetical protein